ncbi:unnamed protein product [Effrenium voratum]|nr:unnamed protein product [Effrenium voratum]
MFLLERLFPEPSRPMFPSNRLRATALELLELHRAVLGAWSNYLFRQETPFVNESALDFEVALGQVEKALDDRNEETVWFLPYEHPTIVDIQYVCSIERMVASAMFFKGMDLREMFPGIDRFLRAFEDLPWYNATKGDFYSLCMSLEPLYGTPIVSKTVRRDQLLPENYRLPFVFASDIEALSTGDTTLRKHYVEAAWSLVRNHEEVARYCCRAAGGQQGRWGRRPGRSKLSDPKAAILEPLLAPLDVLLCTVAEVAFSEAESQVVRARIRKVAKASGMPEGLWPQLGACLAYLRDRICVPRDLSLPAAKLLRTYLAEAYVALRRPMQ